VQSLPNLYAAFSKSLQAWTTLLRKGLGVNAFSSPYAGFNQHAQHVKKEGKMAQDKHHTWQTIGGLVCAILLGIISMAGADDTLRYEVTITNLTYGQVFTPILVASHQTGVTLFTPGQPASLELEVLAEAGDTDPLAALLSEMPEVLDVTDSGGPLPPGQTVVLHVKTSGSFNHISVAAMLVPTNDGFFAINGVKGPRGRATLTLFSPAYDAGSEANDELCTQIPGPPAVCTGEGFNKSREGAEGYVHIHRGIHGIGDLIAANRDWRNPVAEVTIRRTSQDALSRTGPR
jgi:hypothetical protein